MDDKVYVDGHAVMGLYLEDLQTNKFVGKRGRIAVQATVAEVRRLNELFVAIEHVVRDGEKTYECAIRDTAVNYGKDVDLDSLKGTECHTLAVRVLDVKEDAGVVKLKVKHYSREGATLWVEEARFVELMTPQGAVLRKEYLQTTAGKERLKWLQDAPKQAVSRLKSMQNEDK
ncbi:hypothetical protein FT641_20175 [Bacillus paranthracis]|uniref:hypothetical protein n=1 Tax=Bacillus paranthracis TaxID=2026186 RepID=UPI00187AE838|nr:hypothetical protein [Bacillus paranthracis]MBE7114620.1 hypothetical protein [Bacillus paranthracis]MBE7155013.1 hypothetical protein [Bacillus paranthracis]